MRNATHTRSRIIPIFVIFPATLWMTLSVAAFAAQAEAEPEAAGGEDAAVVAEENAAESAGIVDPDSIPVVAEGAEIAELSVREAVNLAIENNLGVEVARHAPLIAEEDISIAWGAYDPLFNGDLSYSKDRTPNASPFSANDSNKTTLTTGGAGLSGLIPYVGADLSLEYSGSRTKSNQGFAGLSPQYDTGLKLAATVPLLKGLVWNEAWTQIEVTGTAHSAELENFREIVMDTVRETVSVYWSLVAEEERLRVAKKSLQTAEALLEQTQIQYEVGVKSKVEVIQSEAGVAARELDVIRADATYRNTQDRLIDAVYGVRLRPSVRLLIQPTDNPSDYNYHEVDPEIATELAMKHRPELASLEFDIERRETLVRFRKNQRLPQLDFNVVYGTSGLQGKASDDVFATPASLPNKRFGDFADTHDDFFRKRGGREYLVGGTFSIPLGNTGPRHSVSKARLELRRAKTQLIQLHQRIILEIRRDIRLLDAARKGIDASERQRIAAAEQLRAERIRLEHGESTPFEVLQKESDLVEAEVAKIEALQLHRTSASSLDRSQGTILRTHNIVVGSIRGLRNGQERESFAIRDLLEPVLP